MTARRGPVSSVTQKGDTLYIISTTTMMKLETS